MAEHGVTLAYAAAVLTVSYPNGEPTDGKLLLDQAVTVAVGPLPPDVYGSKADAIGGGAAEVRLTAAPCQQLRYGLTEGGTVAIDAPDPKETNLG